MPDGTVEFGRWLFSRSVRSKENGIAILRRAFEDGCDSAIESRSGSGPQGAIKALTSWCDFLSRRRVKH